MLIHTAANRRSVLDEQYIEQMRVALRTHRGNVRQAALALRMPYRTLSERITRLGLRPELERIRKTNAAAA